MSVEHVGIVIGHPMLDAVVLANDRVSLTIDVNFGARVLSLNDRNTGREWLLQGTRSIDVSERASYRGAASRGWDECFPTVLPCHHRAWGGPIRDHGILWGRPWDVVEAGPERLHARFQRDGITFARRLSLDGCELTAAYSVFSTRDAAVPYVWSQHCVLAVTPQDRVALEGQGQMNAAGVGFDWPAYPLRDLSLVGRPEDGFVLKCYGKTPARGMAQISGPQGGLRFNWDGAEVPAVGVWLDYGGWPAEGPLHVGLVPSRATWTGGFRAVGKLVDQALALLKEVHACEAAGAFAVEIELVPAEVATAISQRVGILLWSMGAGAGCDAQYLFANDLLGNTAGHVPRHSKAYRDFAAENARLQRERIAAFAEFRTEVENGAYPEDKHLVRINQAELSRFLA